MAKEPNYSAMNNLMLSILGFCKASLIKEQEEVKQSKEELEKNIDKIQKTGEEVSDKLIEGFNAKESIMTSLQDDIDYVQSLMDSVKSIIDDTTIDDKVKNASIKNKTREFFIQYNNSITTNSVVDIKKGESHFKDVISKTKIYGKHQAQIDEMEAQIQEIIGERNIKGIKKESLVEKDLKKRVSQLRKKQTTMSNQQKIVMIHRQSAISKRNAKVAKTEQKLNTAIDKGHNLRQKYYESRLESLKKKKVRVKSARSILFKEKFIAFITKRKYNEHGNFERRSWDKRRLDALEKKSKRKL